MRSLSKNNSPVSKKEPENFIQDVLDRIKKKNKESKLELGSKATSELKCLHSGNYAIDWLFGCGGLPRGKIISISGPSSSGKSSLAQLIVSSIQKQGLLAAWEDAEHAFERVHAKILGVDINKLLLEEPDCGEDVFKNLDAMVKVKELGVIVVDSVAALAPQDELDDSKQMNRLAYMMSTKLRKLNALMTRESPTVIFINQERDKLGIMYGDKTSFPGGKALPFYSSVMLKTVIKEKIKDSSGKKVIGVKTNIINKKNKVGMPFREVIVNVDYRKGINKYSGIIELLVELNIIKKTGKGIYFFNGRSFNREEFYDFFEKNKISMFKNMEMD